MGKPLRPLWSLLFVPLLAGCSMADFAVFRMDSSPSGAQVVFRWSQQNEVGKADSALAVVRTDGTGFRWIPDGKDGMAPAWSPDGRWITFSSPARAGQDVSARPLYLYDVAAHATRMLSPDGGVPMAWREDSQRLLAIRNRRGGGLEALWLKPSGEIVLRLALPFNDYWPFGAIWWPGTDSVALIGGFSSSSDSGLKIEKQDVYLVGASEVRQITRASDVATLGLVPDGGRLLWARPGRDRVRLYSYDRARGAITELEPIPLGSLQVDPGFELDFGTAIAFSPTGSRLLLAVGFKNRQAGQRQGSTYGGIYSARLDTLDLRLVRRSRPGDEPEYMPPVPFAFPHWTRDGNHIVIQGEDKKRVFLALYTVDGRERRVLVSIVIPTPTPTSTPAPRRTAH